MDLGVRHDTRCEKYRKRSDTSSETAGVTISLEYRTPGKISQPIRFEDQKEPLYNTHTHTHSLNVLVAMVKRAQSLSLYYNMFPDMAQIPSTM